MKTMYRYFIALLAIILITSATNKPKESDRLYEKIVFIELTPEEDSVLFKPLSEAWDSSWQVSSKFNFYDYYVMDYANYLFSFENHSENLWTYLHPMLIDGSIQSYYPYDPQSYGLGHWDDGELRFPVLQENESFLNSIGAREQLCYVLGRVGPIPDIPILDEFGEYAISISEEGHQVYTYASPDFYWHQDKDIIKYKLRVSVLVNKNGVEKKRIIKSISPIVNRYKDDTITGEREMLWFDFKELEPYLKKASYIDEHSKETSYLDYILQKVRKATIRKTQ